MAGFLIISAIIIAGLRVAYVGTAGIYARFGINWAIISIIALFMFPAVIFAHLMFYPDGSAYIRQMKEAKRQGLTR